MKTKDNDKEFNIRISICPSQLISFLTFDVFRVQISTKIIK